MSESKNYSTSVSEQSCLQCGIRGRFETIRLDEISLVSSRIFRKTNHVGRVKTNLFNLCEMISPEGRS